MIVEHSFGVQIVNIRHIPLELCLMEKKERKKERRRKRRKKKNKIKILAFDFLDCEEKYWNLEAIFDIRIAKGFHL